MKRIFGCLLGSYHTPKSGIVLRLLQVAVITYSVLNMVLNKRYNKIESFENSISTEVTEGSLKSYQVKYLNDSLKPSHCTNGQFFQKGILIPTACSLYEYYEVSNNFVNGGKITTFIDEVNVKGDVVDCSLCEKVVKCIKNYNNECILSEENYYGVVGTEQINFKINQIVFSSNEEKNVTTVIQFHNKSIGYAFNSGRDISLPLSSWLELADISLDKKNPYFDRFNSIRYTGVNLIIKLNYNNDINPKDIDVVENDVVCVVTVEVDKKKPAVDKEIVYSTYKDNNRNNYILRNKMGVTFTAFTIDKDKPKFSYSYFISCLVEIIVLFELAYSITTFVALYLLGSDSEIYWNYAIKDCNLQKDFVKFTLKTIINTQIFKSVESNALFKDELISLLHESFSKTDSEYHGFRDSNDEIALTDEEINIMADNIMKYAKVGEYDEYYITFSQVMDLIFSSNVEIIKSIKKKINKNYCYCCCCKNFSNYNKNITDIKNDDNNMMNRLVEEGRKLTYEKPKRKPHYPPNLNLNEDANGFRSRNQSINIRFDTQRSRLQSESVKNSLEPTPSETPNSQQQQQQQQQKEPPSTELTTIPTTTTTTATTEARQRRQKSINLDEMKLRSPSASFYLPAGVGGPTGSFHNTAAPMQSPSVQSIYRKSYRKNDTSFRKTQTTPNSPENTVRSRQRMNNRKVNLGVENLVLPPLHIAPPATVSPPSGSSLVSSPDNTPKHKNELNQSKSMNEEDLIKNDEETRKLSQHSHSHHHHHHHHHDSKPETN